jgi:2-keto-4-pentenoate hydratase
MKRDLISRGRIYSDEDVWDAVESYCPCIEVVGKRHCVPDATNLMNLADASCAAGVVCGEWILADKNTAAAQFESLRTLSAHITVDGEQKSTGLGSKCPLGSPVAALTWTVNHLNSRGMALKASELVISGAFCKSRDFIAGSAVVVDFGSLGKVTTTICE